MRDDLLVLFAAAITLSAALAIIGIWSPRKLWVKLSAVIVAGLFMPTAYASLSELLSRPKPVTLEWARRAAEDATVLSSRMREGEAIYVWLKLSDLEEPRAYALPWSEELAKQLHKAQMEAGEREGAVRMRHPFEYSLDESRAMFYAQPQERPPLKPTPTEGPVYFSRPADAS